jgi:hypothetical protein
MSKIPAYSVYVYLNADLYKLVVDEWTKKQKIIDNLCHFSRSCTLI